MQHRLPEGSVCDLVAWNPAQVGRNMLPEIVVSGSGLFEVPLDLQTPCLVFFGTKERRRMGKQDRFADEFKRDALAQVVDRGYAVNEVAERLGISTRSP